MKSETNYLLKGERGVNLGRQNIQELQHTNIIIYSIYNQLYTV